VNFTRARSFLEVSANVIVVVFSLLAIGVLAKPYISRKTAASPPPPLLKNGERLPVIPGLDLGQSKKTLLLTLNVNCRFCNDSLNFYHRLIEGQRAQTGAARIVALFVNKEKEIVRDYVSIKKLPVDYLAAIEFEQLRVYSTPTLILVDESGTVSNLWVGQLNEDQEREVFEQIGVAFIERPPSPRSAKVEKSQDLFDENRPLSSLNPHLPTTADEKGAVSFFDVDDHGTVHLLDDRSMLMYDDRGRLAGTYSLPQDFKPPFVIGNDGSLFFVASSRLFSYSRTTTKTRDTDLVALVPDGSAVLKLAFDGTDKSVFLQIYTPSPLAQKLLRVDLRKGEVKEIFNLKDPVAFSPSYSPGAFDFAVGSRNIYISDIRDYKIFSVSKAGGTVVETLNRPYTAVPFEKTDGALPLRKITIKGFGGGLAHYPPIQHLNLTSDGRLLVWTSSRDRHNRQVVDIYDRRLRFVGTDLKYAHPGRNDYIFSNNKVYVPDLGFGGVLKRRDFSPFEVPAIPAVLKVFEERKMLDK